MLTMQLYFTVHKYFVLSVYKHDCWHYLYMFLIITYLQTKTKKSKKILNKRFAAMKKTIKPTDARMYVIL